MGEILKYIEIPQDKINRTLAYLDTKKRIGDVLIDLDLTTPKELELALKQQVDIRRPLGIVLFQMAIGKL